MRAIIYRRRAVFVAGDLPTFSRYARRQMAAQLLQITAAPNIILKNWFEEQGIWLERSECAELVGDID